MNSQINFSELARTSDPETSQAASKLNKGARETQRHKLLMTYWRLGAMTDEEASDLAHIKHGWKRCSELRNMGYIKPTGKTKKTKSGGTARICRITNEGLSYAAKAKLIERMNDV